MAQLEAADFADLVVATQQDLGRPRFQQIAQNLPEYEVMSRWFRQEKVSFESGRGISRTLMTKLSDQAEWIGLLDTASVDIPDLLDQMTVPWRHLQGKYALEYRADILMNSGPEMIVDLIKVRRCDALISLAKQLEAKAWAVPGSSNKTEPYGLPYWLVADTAEGFNGVHNSGHSTVAGVDAVNDSPNFANYTNQYTTANKADLIKKMKKGLRKTMWKSPVTVDDFRKGRDRYAVYMDETTISAIEDIGEAQNENLGKDVAAAKTARDVAYVEGGLTMVFRNFPIIHAHQMDESSFSITDGDGTARTNPVYLVDHATFYPVCLKGDYLRESEPIRADRQPNVWRVFIDISMNTICVDRRRNAVFAK